MHRNSGAGLHEWRQQSNHGLIAPALGTLCMPPSLARCGVICRCGRWRWPHRSSVLVPSLPSPTLASLPAVPWLQVRAVPEDPVSESEEESDGQYPIKDQV